MEKFETPSSGFPPVSKADWLAKIAKDLKDKPLDALFWQLEEGIWVDPFGHADDFSKPPPPLDSAPKGWEINENIPCLNPAAANAQALEALRFGAESLRFEFEAAPDSPSFSKIFENIIPDIIGLHFSGKAVAENPGLFFSLLTSLAGQRGLETRQLRGSLDFDPASKPGLHDWRYLAELLQFAGENFPGFKIISTAISQNLSPSDELASLLKSGNTYLEKLAERGIAPAKTAAAMQFSTTVGKSYFVEIAKLRAFKLLWLNVLRGWNATLAHPPLDVSFRPGAYTDDLYTNMIRATTMAMSAVLGGANRLTVLPYDAEREVLAVYPQAFSRRIARNVQHLLKMESHLDTVADPAAGSFYVEKLTRQLAEKAWEKFKSNS